MKYRQVPALVVAELNGFVMPRPMEGHPTPRYGIKALPGQYVFPYTRRGHLPEGAVVEDGVVVKQPTTGRVSKGALKRYLKVHGTGGKLDRADYINSRR